MSFSEKANSMLDLRKEVLDALASGSDLNFAVRNLYDLVVCDRRHVYWRVTDDGGTLVWGESEEDVTSHEPGEGATLDDVRVVRRREGESVVVALVVDAAESALVFLLNENERAQRPRPVVEKKVELANGPFFAERQTDGSWKLFLSRNGGFYVRDDRAMLELHRELENVIKMRGLFLQVIDRKESP